jgi:hypothetical protein|tara:strand:- start:266 stop:781 length:516 start_codon:yes stop_codon:yes gene_type:complete
MRLRYLLEIGIVNKRALPLVVDIDAKEMEWWNRNSVRLLQELQMLIDSNARAIFQFNDKADGLEAGGGRRAKAKDQEKKSLVVGKLLQFSYTLLKTGDLEIGKYDKSIGAISCQSAGPPGKAKKGEAKNDGFKHLPLLNYTLECEVHPCKLRPAAGEASGSNAQSDAVRTG